MTKAAWLAALLMFPASALAGVEGYWKTIDDETGRPKSVIQIEVVNGKAKGTIVQLFRQPDQEADPKCTECKGADNGKNVVGLEILRDLNGEGSEWSGGTIMDPANGKTYSCYIEEQEAGKKLKVRGYLGVSLLGRTQIWHRVGDPDPAVRTYLLNSKNQEMPWSLSDGTVASDEQVKAHLAK